jgi:hypothetical protein
MRFLDPYPSQYAFGRFDDPLFNVRTILTRIPSPWIKNKTLINNLTNFWHYLCYIYDMTIKWFLYLNEFYSVVHFEIKFLIVFYEPFNCFKWKTYILLVIISNHFLLMSNYFGFTLLSKFKLIFEIWSIRTKRKPIL